MKKLFILSIIVISLGLQSCKTLESIIIPEGPEAAKLNAEKDKQIVGLMQQVKNEQEARIMEKALASKVASNLKGILKATEYMPDSAPKEAAQEEAKLGLERSPADDPAETVKALERVVKFVTGQRDAALKDVAEARGENQKALKAIKDKEEEINKKNIEIKDRETKISSLEESAKIEKEKHKADITKMQNQHRQEIENIKKEFSDKEQKLWLLGIRSIGLFFILAGGVAIVVFKRLPEGALGLGLGLLIGVVSVGFDKLTSASWFPLAFGILVLIAVIAGAYSIYRLWKKGKLHEKTMAALQDLRDEAGTLGHDTWDKVEEHLKYRLGGKDSFWGKAQLKEVVSQGLIDPKGEESLKSNKSDN